MNRISFAKVSGVSFDSIIVPVNFMGRIDKVTIPINCAKKCVVIYGKRIGINYKSGVLSENIESHLIQYYNELLFIKALDYICHHRREQLCYILNKMGISSCLHAAYILADLGFNYNKVYQMASSRGIVQDIYFNMIDKEDKDELLNWTIIVCKEIANKNALKNNFEGCYTSESDIEILSNINTKNFWDKVEEVLNCEKYQKLFFKNILIPYEKEKEEEKRLKEEKIKSVKAAINECQKKIEELTAELNTMI